MEGAYILNQHQEASSEQTREGKYYHYFKNSLKREPPGTTVMGVNSI